MYRAVEDQLRLRDGGQGLGLSSYSELRQRAVDRMREREVDFLPFFAQVLPLKYPTWSLYNLCDALSALFR